MCKCFECNKKDTESCIRLVECVNHQQAETMLHIQNEALKTTVQNQWKYIEEILRLVTSEHFKNNMIMEEVQRREAEAKKKEAEKKEDELME